MAVPILSGRWSDRLPVARPLVGSTGAPTSSQQVADLPMRDDEGRRHDFEPEDTLARCLLHVLADEVRRLPLRAASLRSCAAPRPHRRRYRNRGRARKRSCPQVHPLCRVRCAAPYRPVRPCSGRSHAACTRRPSPCGVSDRKLQGRARRSAGRPSPLSKVFEKSRYGRHDSSASPARSRTPMRPRGAKRLGLAISSNSEPTMGTVML